jgi:hypothetical protein
MLVQCKLRPEFGNKNILIFVMRLGAKIVEEVSEFSVLIMKEGASRCIEN